MGVAPAHEGSLRGRGWKAVGLWLGAVSSDGREGCVMRIEPQSSNKYSPYQ